MCNSFNFWSIEYWENEEEGLKNYYKITKNLEEAVQYFYEKECNKIFEETNEEEQFKEEWRKNFIEKYCIEYKCIQGELVKGEIDEFLKLILNFQKMNSKTIANISTESVKIFVIDAIKNKDKLDFFIRNLFKYY